MRDGYTTTASGHHHRQAHGEASTASGHHHSLTRKALLIGGNVAADVLWPPRELRSLLGLSIRHFFIFMLSFIKLKTYLFILSLSLF